MAEVIAALCELIICLVMITVEIGLVLIELAALVVEFLLEILVAIFSRESAGTDRKRSDGARRIRLAKRWSKLRSNSRRLLLRKPDEKMDPKVAWGTAILMTSILIILGATIGGLIYVEKQRAARKKNTRSTITLLAEKEYESSITSGEFHPIKDELTSETDAWGEWIVLDRVETLLGDRVSVRSSGPDRRMGTQDDLEVSRTIAVSTGEVAGELLQRGGQNLAERARNMMGNEDEVEAPEADLDENETDAEASPSIRDRVRGLFDRGGDDAESSSNSESESSRDD